MNTVFIDTGAFFRAKRVLIDLIEKGYKLATSIIAIYDFYKIIDELIANEENPAKRDLYLKLRRNFPKLLRELEVEIIPFKIDADTIEEACSLMEKENVDMSVALTYIFLHRFNITSVVSSNKNWKRLKVNLIEV